ncbi:MAG: metallophosphoesterase, partial [Succinivibrio sp.]|nr:metallophosphoesterase [Succinivibrio sp.]
MQQRILKSAFNLNTTALGFILMLLLSLIPLRALAYELVMLGDLHYDAQNLHTAAYFEQHKSQHQRTLSRNLSSWEGAAPSHALLEEAGQASEQSLFAIQVGDFAHGHAGSQALAAKMYAQVLKLLKANFKVPVYITPGNHEYAGAGASSALDATLKPYLSALLPQGSPLDNFNYSLEKENDVFIFFNCIKPDLDFLKQQLTAHAKARYTFVITHYPVLPIARGDLSFLLYGKSEEQQKREELLNLLCEHNVIVLCG